MLNHGRCLSLSEFAHVAQNDSPRRESAMSGMFDVANDFVAVLDGFGRPRRKMIAAKSFT
jgi:hypothetical protein